MMRYSKYQNRIFEYVHETEGNLIINACAGSGKSTTLFKIAKILNNKDILFFAFNTHIEQYASNKLKPCTNVKVKTTHAYGLSCIKSSPKFKHSEFSRSKLWDIVEKTVSSFKLRGLIYNAVDTLRTFGCMDYERKPILQFINDNPTIVDQFGNFNYVIAQINVIGDIMQKLDKNKKLYDFNDMLRFPILYNLLDYGYKPEVLLIDECFQYYTPVLVDYDKWVTIGEIVENPTLYTHVLSYDLEQKKIMRKKITGRLERESSSMIEFCIINDDGTEGYVRCTPNHKMHIVDVGTVYAKNVECGDQVITYNANKFYRVLPHEGKMKTRTQINLDTLELEKCPECKKSFRRLDAHYMREHTDEGIVVKEKAKRAALKFWRSEASNEIRLLNSQKMSLNNPMHYKETRKKAGIGVKKAFWSKSKEEQEIQTRRFMNAPYAKDGGRSANCVEQKIIELNIDNLLFTGCGTHFIHLDIGGKRRLKNPDFICAPSKCGNCKYFKTQCDEDNKRAEICDDYILDADFKPKKVVEIMDYDYWHSESEIKPLKSAYSDVGVDCLVLNAKMPIAEMRERIESFINNHYGTIKSIKTYARSHRVYDINVEGTHLFWVGAVNEEYSKRLSSSEPKCGVKFPVLVHNCQDLSQYQFEYVKNFIDNDVRVIAVGDENQAIYNFRGANGDALDTVQELSNAKRLPLSITYRCKSNIVEYVKKVYEREEYELPQIESNEDGGRVRKLLGTLEDCYCLEYLLHRNVQMIVSPKNKHIINIWFELLEKHDTPSSLKGSNITAMLSKLFKGLKSNTSFVGLVGQLSTLAKSEDDAIADMAQAGLRFITCQKFTSYDAILAKIDTLDKDTTSKIHLHTVHSSKGMESDKVWLVDDFFDSDQKINMQYVGLTRASDELYIVKVPK